MTDTEFTEEMAKRLTAWLEADPVRAMSAVVTPMAHAGYANVGHFLGQLCLPPGVDRSTPGDELQDVKFLMPVVDEKGGIISFRAVPGHQLAQEHAQMQQRAAQAENADPKVH